MKNSQHSIYYYFTWILLGLFAGLIVLILQGQVKIPGLTGATDDLLSNQASGYSNAVSRVLPSVVNIQIILQSESAEDENEPDLFSHKKTDPPTETKPKLSSGSGVILDPRGYVLTNYHVIADAKAIKVTLNDGRKALAQIVGNDPDTDLAVLKIELDHLPRIEIADIKQVRTGDLALAIGYPFRIGQTVTQGIISATGRTQVSSNTYENFLQTDAAINPGNSGGALINTRGEIVGINSLIFTKTGGFQGIGFAIPIDLAEMVLEQIIENGYVVRGWLGVEGVDLSPQILLRIGLPDINGILLTGIDPDGPGDKAGLKTGDIITHINGEAITSVRDILNKIAAGKPGDHFEIEGLRQRQSFSTHAELGQRPVMSSVSE